MSFDLLSLPHELRLKIYSYAGKASLKNLAHVSSTYLQELRPIIWEFVKIDYRRDFSRSPNVSNYFIYVKRFIFHYLGSKDEDAEVLSEHFQTALCHCGPVLQRVCIDAYHLDMDGKALSVLKRLSHLKELVIMDTGKVRYTPVNGPAWKAIADVQSLKTLTLYLVPIESIAFREACVGDGFQALTELSLTNGSMKDPALANMKNLVSLEILDLSWNSITDVVFKRIYRLPRLREIDVGSCKRIKTIPPLIELPSLEKLSMSGTKISDASIRNVSMFPGLKCLDISF